MLEQDLKRSAAKFPKSPGIYQFKDARGKPLYIGKALNLKSRVSAYLKTDDSRIQTMIRMARTVSVIQTDSDIEALLTESKLIKERQPRFNIMLRDDKQYFFVAFTDENFPKVFLTHQAHTRKIRAPTSTLIGPFTDGAVLKAVLRFLRGIFPYCTCTQQHHVPCLNSHIGKCLGFCCLKQQNPELKVESEKLKVQRKEYAHNIRGIKDVLTGKRRSLIRKLEHRMKTLGKRHKLREALELQATVAKLKRIFENARVISRGGWQTNDTAHKALAGLRELLGSPHTPIRIEGYDISNISGEHATGSMVVFSRGAPDKQQYRLFNIRRAKNSDDTAMLREVLGRRLAHADPDAPVGAHWPFPDLIIVDGGKGQLNAAFAVLSKLKVKSASPRQAEGEAGERLKVIALTKNSRHQAGKVTYKENGTFKEIKMSKLPEGTKNLIVAVDAEAHRFAIKQYRRRHAQTLVARRTDRTV